MYLTVEEVRAARVECGNARVKDAFLFSCLTGLRISDIRRLSWADVHEQDGFTRIIFRQKKTRGQEYLDVNAEARKLMGTRGGDAEAVFGGLPGKTAVGRDVARWMLRADIRKKVTFHCARHTFTTMMLALGTDLYTVSKQLGHREIGMTQVYARVVDKGKREARVAHPARAAGRGRIAAFSPPSVYFRLF